MIPYHVRLSAWLRPTYMNYLSRSISSLYIHSEPHIKMGWQFVITRHIVLLKPNTPSVTGGTPPPPPPPAGSGTGTIYTNATQYNTHTGKRIRIRCHLIHRTRTLYSWNLHIYLSTCRFPMQQQHRYFIGFTLPREVR